MEPRVFTAVIADDIEGLRRLLRLVLEDSGRFHIVGEAGDGVEAIEKTRELQPDILLLDIAMPRMTGLQAIPGALRDSPRTKIVIVSGIHDNDVAVRSVELGASAFLLKGMEPDRLVERLVDVLEGPQTPVAGGGALP